MATVFGPNSNYGDQFIVAGKETRTKSVDVNTDAIPETGKST